jgi:cytochrome c553
MDRVRQPAKLIVSWLAWAILANAVFAGETQTGKQIYAKQCAMCHGAKGEGTDDNFPRALEGDKSLAQLTRLIAKTMPKDSKVKCTGEIAEKVAKYIYDAFYSRAAQARNKPARVELARLTVRQYRNAVADLVGSFRNPLALEEQRGLKATYFKSFGFGGNNRVLERVDPTVHFDFGVTSPVPKKIEDHQFGIRWEGALLAPDTGEYEIIVKTESAVRLWLNDQKQPLIDAWVKSGNDSEFHASIFLLGGRAYPLKLEFAKGKQGVADGKKDEAKPPPTKASIALEWKLPQRPAEVIPQRNLTPKSVPEVFVVTTAFPPDDRSVGYERGTRISKAWDKATTDAAIEVAAYVSSHFRELSHIPDSAADPKPVLKEFCTRFAERAFRRPMTDEQKRLLIDRPIDGIPDPELAVKRVVLFVLKSPRFLYREIGETGDAYDVASRISFGLWDSLPDGELLEAAKAGKLAQRDQVMHQAERMVGDARTHSKLREFMLQWLKVDNVPELSKDMKRYPGFDAAMASDLRTSLDLFLEDVLWSQSSDFRQLLLADGLFLNGRLAKFYGADLPADASFQKVTTKPNERAGVLSHPYLMATFSYTGTTSPIHRGVFLTRNVLGRALQPPPEAFAPLSPDLHPNLTTRERILLQTKPEACQVCHGMINPLGFTLEQFDAVGRFRDKENDKPIDATGAYLTRSGEQVKFSGVRDLAKFLAACPETHDAFVEHLFHCLVKQPIRAFGPNELADLRGFFTQHDFNVRKLMVEIIASSAITPQAATKTTKAGFWMP